MKKITSILFMIFIFLGGNLIAQNSPDYIFGDDNGAGWNWTTGTQGTTSLGSSYKWQFAATATANHYFKFGETSSNADGSGFWTNNAPADMNYTGAGAKWTAYYNANMGGGGAIYTAITSGNYYVIKARKQASNDIDFAVFDNGASAPVTISSVTRTISGNDLTVTATASAAAGTNEKIWVRYSKDNWTTSTTSEMTFTSGTSYTATLNFSSGDFVSYYVYTTINQTSAPAESDADFFTVNYNNNSDKNYTVQIGPFSGNYYIPQGTNAKGFDLLSTAINNINTTGVDGDVVFYITDNITEPANIGLGVNTNGHSITIRPDQDADRTITFTKLADNSSPTGHFIIGYLGEGLTSAWSDDNTIATSNVTIDGFAEGGSTRRLTFTNTNASHTNARVIVVVGACENTVIKNCIINNLTTHNGSPFCVGAVVRKGTAIEVAPTNFTVENNIMTALGNNVAMGMRITNSGTISSASLTGLVIKNNVITARRRLIEINYTTGGDIYNNEFKTQATGAAGTVTYGIWTSTGVTGTINIYNNKFTQAFTEETGAFGHRVISLASGATYNVYNNMFAGLDKTKPSTVALNLVYLFYSGVSGKIYNNTFYMPKLTDASSTGYYNAIQISGNTAEIKNNIFISDEDTHSNTAFISAVPNPASDYNNFYLRHSHSGSKIVSTYTTLADYQAANPTKDVHSKSKDVYFVSTTDLHLTGSSLGDVDLIADPSVGITTDIDGETRNANYPYMGADENLAFPLPVELTSFAANVLSNGVELKWHTATEINNYGFDIERSIDKQNWVKLGFVEGSGNSNSPKNYSFVDEDIKNQANGKYYYRLKQINTDGSYVYSNTIEIDWTNGVTDVNDESNLPKEFSLSQNYPNPFNPTTKIKYAIPYNVTQNSISVQLIVYDITGKEVITLVNEEKTPGEYEVEFNGRGLSSGIYIYRLQAGNFVNVKKMILMK